MNIRKLVTRAGRIEAQTHAEFKDAVEDAGKAKRKLLGGKRKRLPDHEHQRLIREQRGRCALSGEPLEKRFTEDHIIPFCFGGGEEAANKRLTNSAPNRQRGNRIKTAKLYRFLLRQA